VAAFSRQKRVLLEKKKKGRKRKKRREKKRKKGKKRKKKILKNLARMAQFLVFFAAIQVLNADPVPETDPWGIHIAYGPEESNSMTFQWSTRDPVPESIVSLLTPTTLNFSGSVTPFSLNGNVQSIHRVEVTGLKPGTRYSYTVGSEMARSETFTFSTQPSSPTAMTIAIWGDMGISANALATMPLLLKDVESGEIDVLVHVGDLAYDLQSNAGATGDAYMQQMQPVAANIPYHVCPGNVSDYLILPARLAAVNTPSLNLLLH